MAGTNKWLRRLSEPRDVALADALGQLDEARSGLGWVKQQLELHPDNLKPAIDHATYHQNEIIRVIKEIEERIEDGEGI